MADLKTINSTVRTGIAIVLLGTVGYGGWFGYNNYVKPSYDAKKAIEELADLKDQFEAQTVTLTQTRENLEQAEIANEKLSTSLRLLKIDRRMANVEVLDIVENEIGEPEMLVRFSEVDVDGNVIGTERDFTLTGDKLYIDCWIVTFDDKYVEQADELRATSLCVFKSIYGNIDGPSGAQSLDRQTDANQVPVVYRTNDKNTFEQKIWGDFWNVCNDAVKQKDLGIRASYGQANYVLAEKGRTYQVHLRSSGGASLKPIRVDDEP